MHISRSIKSIFYNSSQKLKNILQKKLYKKNCITNGINLINFQGSDLDKELFYKIKCNQ